MRIALALGVAMLTATAVSAQQQGATGQNMGGGSCSANAWNCADAPNPLPPTNSVWIEEMTWMDVRDAIADGKTTVIIAAGGVEPNGPFLATGKHNYVLKANCEAIARRMGTALCAPIVKFVPEGNIDPPSSHMTSPGTISMRQETYEAMLTDIASSMAQHGFENIIFIGDSGGNGGGMTRVAQTLTEQWQGSPVIAYVPEHYEYGAVGQYMEEEHGLIAPAEVEWNQREAAEEARLVEQWGAGHACVDEGMDTWEDANPQTWDDDLHDDPVITLNMYASDPSSVSWERRVQAGLASINGVSVEDPVKNAELAAKIVDFRADYTIAGIEAAIAAGGNVPDEDDGGRRRGGGGEDEEQPNCG